MSTALRDFSRAREMATGVPLSVDFSEPAGQCESESDLDMLISKLYRLFREELRSDISFLEREQKLSVTPQLTQLIYVLRTARQHKADRKTKAQSANWRSSFKSPLEASDDLLTRRQDALTELTDAAFICQMDPNKRARWFSVITVHPGGVLPSVAEDLGLSFTPNNTKRMVRNVNSRLDNTTENRPREVLVAEYCVQEILSQHRALPVPYQEVLDALGVLGKREARAVADLAYSVSRARSFSTGEDFIASVTAAWTAVRNGS